MPAIETTPELVARCYERLSRNVEILRRRLGRPLSYAEKIMLGHLDARERAALDAGHSYLDTRPDRVAMQDATAQMAVLQFMLAQRDETAVPTSIHCDHLIQARVGAAAEIEIEVDTNREVYQ
jgi:aconitate hydratase